MEKQDLDTDTDTDADTVDSTSYIRYTQGQLGSSGLVFSMFYTSLTMADQRGSASTMPPFFFT